MILDVRGAADSAYFYMAWVIAGVISIIPVSLSTSLFAEGSHSPERLNRHTKRLVWQSVALLCPIVGIIYVLAGFLLNIFGHGYSVNGTEVLRILLLANFPMVVNCFYDTVNAVRKKMGLIILQAFATSFLTLGMSYVFLGRFGVTGVAMAYTLANLIVAMGVWMPLWKFANSNDSDVGPA
jgi:O-antigen/teichoic acid export membrane protein